MTPLTRFVLGMVVVLVDVRINGLDLVPDLLGWVLVLAGLARLVSRSGWFQVATGAAALELLLSVVELTQPAGGLLGLVDVVATTVLVFAVCTGVIAAAGSEQVRAAGDPVRWTNLVLGLVSIMLVATLSEDQTPGRSLGFLIVLVLASLAAVIWFLAFCWNRRALPELV